MMKFALLIYESPDAFASRKDDGSNTYTGAWRAYHKALVESDVFVGGDPLEVPDRPARRAFRPLFLSWFPFLLKGATTASDPARKEERNGHLDRAGRRAALHRGA